MRPGSYQPAAHPLCSATVAAAADYQVLGMSTSRARPLAWQVYTVTGPPFQDAGTGWHMQAFDLRVHVSPDRQW